VLGVPPAREDRGRVSPAARHLLRESRMTWVVGALRVLTTARVIAQALLLAGLVARGFAGAPLRVLRPALLALGGVFAVRALVQAAFASAGRAGALTGMSYP